MPLFAFAFDDFWKSKFAFDDHANFDQLRHITIADKQKTNVILLISVWVICSVWKQCIYVSINCTSFGTRSYRWACLTLSD